MLAEDRRNQLVQWLEMNWSTRTPAQRGQLLGMDPRMRGLAAGHEALGGLEQEECASAAEVVERFFKEKQRAIGG